MTSAVDSRAMNDKYGTRVRRGSQVDEGYQCIDKTEKAS